MEEKENDILTVEEKIVKMLRTVYDPEIPVNVYDLGLIYSIEVDDEKKVESIDDVKSVDIQLVFEPEWDKDMMSEEAKLELGFL